MDDVNIGALEQREADVASRERALDLRIRRERALGELRSRDLPVELMRAVCLDTDETCRDSVDEVARAFETAVASRVSKYVGGPEPVAGPRVPDEGSLSDAQYYRRLMDKRLL